MTSPLRARLQTIPVQTIEVYEEMFVDMAVLLVGCGVVRAVPG